MIRLLLTLVLTAAGCGQVAAHRLHFRHLTGKDGLPHQQVEALAQDHKGYVWIGTRNGLARYDGYEMTCYYHEQGNPTTLANSFVKALLTDSRGRLWVCTMEGVSRYEPQTDSFKTYSDEQQQILSIAETSDGTIAGAGNGLFVLDEQRDSFVAVTTPDVGFIVSLAPDRQGCLYFASNNAIFCYNQHKNKITQFDSSLYADFLTGADGVVPMLVDHAGDLWVGRNGRGVSRISLESGKAEVFFPDQLVRCIDEDREHNMTFGTENGVYIIDSSGTVLQIRHDLHHPELLSDNAIYSLLNDRENNHWVGSYFGGVDIMLTGAVSFRWMEPGSESHQIRGRILRSMAEVGRGTLWVATEGDGLVVTDLIKDESRSFSEIPAIGKNVHSLYYDKDAHEMWIGTFRNGLFRYNLKTGAWRRYLRERGLDSDAIFFIARQMSGRLWVATTQGLRYYDSETDSFKKTGEDLLDTRFAYTLHVDRRDNLWVGMANAGLYRIDAKTQRIDHWEEGQSGLNDNYVTCLYEDSGGTMCIGTNVAGLQYMRHGENVIRTFAKEWNLSNYTICSIVEDESHHLWVSTNQGLIRLDTGSGGITRFTIDNGLPTNQFNFSSSLLGSDGMLYFGTVRGLVSFCPPDLKASAPPLDVHWKRLLIGNRLQTASVEGSPVTEEFDEMSAIRLTYEQARQFTIDFGVVMPTSAHAIHYQVKVDGIDQDWRDVGTHHSVNGFRLASGTYVLHVRANDLGNDWDGCPERVLTLIVLPPLWLAWWAWLAYMLIAAGLSYFVWHYFRSRQQSREAIRRVAMEKEKIQTIDKAKFEFFTSVSHELKTPLSLIKAPLKNIQRQETLGTDGRRNLDIALKNAGKIEMLVDELVTYNKVETDAFRLYVQQGNPMEFIKRTVGAFRELAMEKRIRMVLDCEDNGEQAWFSPQYVEHILGNLLSNAVKFTPEGGTVTVGGAIVTQTGRDYLRIKVSDTGIGIVAEELGRIFDRYYQTQRGYNTVASGWGIGLSLVKRLAEIHKGSVSVESKVGEGSTFTVLLCVSGDSFDQSSRIVGENVLVAVSDYKLRTGWAGYSQDTPEDLRDEDNNGTTVNEITVLVVEDHSDMREFLRTQLSAHYRVLTAGNGREALLTTRREMVHLVVSDVMMPEMDGFELCRNLKESMDTSHIPVILLTAKSESDDVATGYRAGADAYVSKPFDIGILEMQIGNILKLVRSRQQEIVDAQTEDLSAASLTVLDRDFLQRMKAIVEENLGNSDFSVTDVTSALGISRSLLHVKMKNLMNLSMGDYIRHQRLERACQMLRDGYNVSETAYATGFTDPNYFSKTFKKQLGVNPTEYIAQQRNYKNQKCDTE